MRKLLIVFQWAFASVAVIALVTLPISLETQLVAGMCVLVAMMVLKLIRPDGIWRLIALAFGTAIVMRYVYWRTTSTLPPLNQPENFIPGFLLYLAEMYSVMMLALSLFVVAQPLPPRPSRAKMNDRMPTVDVFIPTYNEEPELLANTMAAAKGLDYPQDRLNIWLLDDGGTVQKRNSDKIGDAIISTAFFKALRGRFPDAQIDIVLGRKNGTAAPLLPHLDGRHSVSTLLAQLRSAGADDSVLTGVMAGFRQLWQNGMVEGVAG